jgi:hypothetical protein
VTQQLLPLVLLLPRPPRRRLPLQLHKFIIPFSRYSPRDAYPNPVNNLFASS